MDEKLRLLLIAMRAMASEFIAAIEDYLDMSHEDSLLYKRRKRREFGNG